MDQRPVEVLNESDVLIATAIQDNSTDMLDMPGYGLFPMKQGKPLAVKDADSTEMAEDLVGDMGTATEEAGDNICKDDGVTRVNSAEQDTECKSITDYMPAMQTNGNGRLASSPNKEGHLLLTTKPTECTTVEIYIDLNNETSDVAEGNADADLQTASGSCSISALDKASTGDLKKSNTADVLQTKTDTYKASTCEQEKQAEDISTDDSKPKKPVPDIQKIESSDEDSFTSKSVESTDENYMEIPDEENYMEIPDENLPDKQTHFLGTDGEAVVVDDDSNVIEIADSPAKQAVAIPEFQSVKGDALKGAESTKPLASKPELLYDRGFLTPVPKSLSKLKQLTVNIGPIRLIDLQCKKLHNLLQINPTCAIKFEPKERTLDNGLKIVDSCGYVRLPFKVSWPSRLVKISDKLSDLNINGRDMSVKFPEAFNKAVQECKAWVQQRNQYLIYTDFKVKQRRVMTQQWPKEETSGEKLKSLFPQVDKIIMQIGKDYDDKDICLAVYLEFATLTALENFMSTGSSSICLDGRLITFTKIIKRVRPHGVPKQVGNTTPTRKNFPAYASQFGASAFGTRGQRGLGQGFRGRGGRDLRGRGGSMGGVRGRAGGIAISPRSTLQKAHYSPGVFPQKTVSKQEAVMNALKMVIETGTPVKTAAKQYGVDHYLLRDKVQRMVDRPTVMTGQGPLFSTEEEAQLVSHVKYMANLGNGLTISEVVAKATDYAVFLKKRTHDNPLSVEWFHRFRRRWPEIKDVQFKDVFSPHNQFEVDLGTRERDKFEPQRDIWSHEPHDDRQRQGDRSRSPSRFEHNKQRQSASKSDETRAMLESMKSKLENLERKLAEQGGSMLPPVDVKKDVFPEKKRGQGAGPQGSRGQHAGKKWGRGRGAGQPGQTHKQQGYQPKQQGYKSPRQQSPGQSFKHAQPQVSSEPSKQTVQWSGSNDQKLLPDREWGQPAFGKFETSWSYDRGQFADEPRTDLGQGQRGRGSSGAGRDGGYRGRGKSRNMLGGKRKADTFNQDYQTSTKRPYFEENFKDTSFQYGAVNLWQQESYPNMQNVQTPNRETYGDRSQGDRDQGRENTFTRREHTFPSPYQEQGFPAPNTSYYQQY